jgi:predicted ATPase
MLLDHSARHALALWHATGRYLDAVLRSEQGETVTRFLRTALDEIHEASFETRYLPLLTALAEIFCKAGEIANGRAAIDQAIERCRQSEELWYLPELLRVSGEIVLQEGASAPEAAELQFLQALDLARRQEVLSWELRAATSLARLWRGRGRPADARAQLASVYDRFTEGFETADLRCAKQLLDDLGREVGRPN